MQNMTKVAFCSEINTKENREKRNIHNNLSATRQAAFIPPTPQLPFHPEPPNT
jgi:hypothetical protein